jgi:hypothetical protein
MKLLIYQRSDPDWNMGFMQNKTDKRCTCIFNPGEIMWDLLKLPRIDMGSFVHGICSSGGRKYLMQKPM